MRIALVHMRHAHTGGTERYLNLVAKDLAEAGHEPVVVCRSHEEPPHPAVRFVELRPLAVGAAHRMLGFAKAVEAHVASTSYDVVFGLGKTWSHDVIRMGGGCHATYLELAHDATRSRLERLVRKGARKHALALEIEARALAPHTSRIDGGTPHVITNSELVKRDVLARYRLDPTRITVIHNGTDTERFHPRRRAAEGAALRAKLGLTTHDEVLLFLGTGYGRKGLDAVLDATARLVPQRPQLHVMVVGYDSGADRFAAHAAELDLTERTRFLGGRRDAEVCFAAADVYALPTRYDPFANSTLEAMAAGLPVITTPTNGGSELITSGESGHVLEATPDTEAFTDELAGAIDHWLDRREAGGQAARVVAEAHDAAHMTRRTRELLTTQRRAQL
jgi:UDP-glucose:(heptosyl)LPS alpha-1,3-glucosyltransferase